MGMGWRYGGGWVKKHYGDGAGDGMGDGHENTLEMGKGMGNLQLKN